MAGNIASIYTSFLFQMHMGIRKQKFHSEELCTKSRNALSSETRNIFKRKKDFAHDLTVFVILCKGKY